MEPVFCPWCGLPRAPHGEAGAASVAKGHFRSKRQWKWCFANGMEFCHRWAHNTPGGSVKRYRGLPAKVKGKGGKRTRRRTKKVAGSFHQST
jgi:hypothetical protein